MTSTVGSIRRMAAAAAADDDAVSRNEINRPMPKTASQLLQLRAI
jgi:hypothetical protein